MLSAEDLTSLALEKADAFDYNFMNQLMTRLNAATSQEVGRLYKTCLDTTEWSSINARAIQGESFIM